MYRIIFVCHGNICRSPAAEFIMADLLRKQGLEDAVSVCSRATSFEEIGNDTYPPMKRALAEANVPIYPRQAARITQTDYDQSDAIYYMDQSNLSYLRRIVDDRRGILRPITELVPDLEEIEDPWY
ncbi:MAG: low molecular weight phosphotyrosine protein phosphatase, partial [Bacilli bacterium]|nr:low molecular weight phosphotyrosine protein phosphatase [Bacilli bacterium]